MKYIRLYKESVELDKDEIESLRLDFEDCFLYFIDNNMTKGARLSYENDNLNIIEIYMRIMISYEDSFAESHDIKGIEKDIEIEKKIVEMLEKVSLAAKQFQGMYKDVLIHKSNIYSPSRICGIEIRICK